MNLETLLQDYGYWAILVGTFLEGETILILGGVAAQFGHLELAWVILSAFAGSAAGDQLYYFIGRWQGRRLLDCFPRWRKPAARVADHVRRHQNLIILTFRFFYGLRNVTPFVLGISHVSVPRYVTLNLLGAAIWAVSFALLGFLLGEAHERLLGRGYGPMLVLALVLLAVAYWAWRRWRDSRETVPPAEAVAIPVLDEPASTAPQVKPKE